MLIRLENGCGNSHNFHTELDPNRETCCGGGGIPKFEYFSDIVKGSFRLAELVISFKESVHSYVHVEVGT